MVIDDDAAFWGHDTWNDENDSGNESFHSSDEDAEVKQDVFDSDFDESESDRDEEEEAAGDEEDRQLARGEKKRKEVKSTYSEVHVGKQQPLRGKRMKGTKRIVGHGLNAGIVLNAPGSVSLAAPVVVTSAVVNDSSLKTTLPSKSEPRKTLAATRPRRANKLAENGSRLKATYSDATTATGTHHCATLPPLTTSTAPAPQQTNKKKRHRHTQEELLLEAAHETEAENVRWLLARKRDQELQKDNERRLEGRGRGSAGKVIIMQYSSRRGYLNTLTFPEMDHVPEILRRNSHSPVEPPPQTFCVITGLKAHYRDPRTGLGYHDLAAYKELRRRSDAGEPIDQRKLEAQARPESVETQKSSSLCDGEIKQTKVSDTACAGALKNVEPSKTIASVKNDATSSSSSSDVVQAPEPSTMRPAAEQVASTNSTGHSRPRKPSRKVLEARDSDILTSSPHTSSPATISPTRPSQEQKGSLATII